MSRSLPTQVKSLMIKFPMWCLVKANRKILIPWPETVGIVTSYYENGEVLEIQQCPSDKNKANCLLEWLEVVGYWRGLTSEKMQKLFEKQSEISTLPLEK